MLQRLEQQLGGYPSIDAEIGSGAELACLPAVSS